MSDYGSTRLKETVSGSAVAGYVFAGVIYWPVDTSTSRIGFL